MYVGERDDSVVMKKVSELTIHEKELGFKITMIGNKERKIRNTMIDGLWTLQT